MEEIWTAWQSENNINKKYTVDQILHNGTSLEIILHEQYELKKKISLLFGSSIILCRFADESYRLKLAEDLLAAYGPGFFAKRTFFVVQNSALASWVTEQASHTADDVNFIHLVVLADNMVIDLITTYEPKIVILE